MRINSFKIMGYLAAFSIITGVANVILSIAAEPWFNAHKWLMIIPVIGIVLMLINWGIEEKIFGIEKYIW